MYWQACQFPARKAALLLVLWLGCSLTTFLKGGNGFPSIIGLTCDQPAYAAVAAIQFCWLLLFALWNGFELVKERERREMVNYPFLPGDIRWSNKNLFYYSLTTLCAGVVAGLIGIGGGVCLGPILLHWGLNPRVSTATTVTMIVITSSTVAFLYVIIGLVPLGYALFYSVICLLGSLVGKIQIDAYVKRHKRSSLLILILACIISLASVGVATNMIIGLESQSWCLDGFKALC